MTRLIEVLISLAIVLALFLVIGLVLLSVTQLWPGYMSLAERRLAGAELYHGQTFELAAHLKNIANPDDTIFLGGDILIYWLMKKYPVVPVAAFPANILDEDGILKPLYGPAATKEAVLERLFLVAPTRIVLSPYMNVLSSVQFFRDALARDYDLESETLDRQIFRRREITSSHGQR